MSGRKRRIGLIYDALVDDEVFAALPAALAESYGARSTLIHWHYKGGGADVLAHSGHFTDAQLQRYASEFAPLDPWARAAIARQSPNSVVNLEELVPDEEYARSPFYNEFIRPMGDDTFRCAGMLVANQWGAGMIALQRGRGQARFGGDTLAAVARDMPHLRRMLSVRGTLGSARHRARSLEGMLDPLAHAAFLLRPDGSVFHMNAAAADLLRREKSILLRRGRLDAVPQKAGFRAALARACGNPPEAGAILLPRPQARPLVMSLAPVVSAAGERQALAMVQEPEAGPGAAAWLRELYRLSPAEAQIAVRLADGLSVAEIAGERGAGVGTVRLQLKSIAHKLQCHRQSEIVAIVRGLPPVRSAAP